MYKVMIVDDEQMIREGISHTIRRSCPAFSEIIEAEDGEKALLLTAERMPDLIITDIQMPNRSGLDFIEQVKAENPDVSIIIISGYDEFRYAQQGLKLGVDDYLLKPIDSKTLAARINQLAEEMDRKLLYQKSQAEIEQLVKESLPLFRERLYRSLIEGHRDLEGHLKRARRLGIPMDRRFYTVVLIRYEEHAGGLETEAMIADMANVTAKRYGQDLEIHPFFAEDMELVLIIGSDELTKEECFGAISQYLHRLGRALQKNMHLEHMNIAVGSVSQSIHELSLSYKQAHEAMLYRLSVKNRMIINYEELGTPAIPDEQASVLLEEVILQVKLLNKEQAFQSIRNYMEDLTSVEGSHPHWVKLSIFELVISMLKLMKDARLDINKFVQDEELDPYTNIFRLDSSWELQAWLKHFAERCIDEMQRSTLHKGVSHVEKVKQYVEAHYADSGLSLNDLAAKLFLSPNYLRQLFRQETGESFVEYLTRIRMERALEYLKNPLLKIQDVAEKVGFEEQRYFSSCFKKHYHMTPTEYREATQDESLT